jgi:hypothetical protein
MELNIITNYAVKGNSVICFNHIRASIYNAHNNNNNNNSLNLTDITNIVYSSFGDDSLLGCSLVHVERRFRGAYCLGH